MRLLLAIFFLQKNNIFLVIDQTEMMAGFLQ